MRYYKAIETHHIQINTWLRKEFHSLMGNNSAPVLCLFFTGMHIEAPVHKIVNYFEQSQVLV